VGVNNSELKNYSKLTVLVLFTLNNHFAAHLFNDAFANRKAKSSSTMVYLLVFVKSVVVRKQMIDVLFTDASPIIFKSHSELNVLDEFLHIIFPIKY
jgi:hypothetical protein